MERINQLSEVEGFAFPVPLFGLPVCCMIREAQCLGERGLFSCAHSQVPPLVNTGYSQHILLVLETNQPRDSFFFSWSALVLGFEVGVFW